MERYGFILFPESRRHGEVDPWGLELTDSMGGEGRFMRHDAPTSGPQGPPRQVVIDVGDPFRKAEKPAINPEPVPGTRMMGLGLIGVAKLPCLSRGEVAGLFGCKVE